MELGKAVVVLATEAKAAEGVVESEEAIYFSIDRENKK